MKEFLLKIWDKLKWILAGALATCLLVFGIKKKSTEKQISKNEETIEDIKEVQEIIDESIKDSEDAIKEIKKINTDATETVNEIKKENENTDSIISRSKEILEKYKK